MCIYIYIHIIYIYMYICIHTHMCYMYNEYSAREVATEGLRTETRINI